MQSVEMKLSTRSKRFLRLDKLCHDLRQSRFALKPYRDNFKKMIVLDAGADWSDNAAKLRRPYNGISLFKQTMRRALINQTPRVMLSTWRKEHRRTVATAQNWANRQFKKIKLGEHLERCIVDALFWMGIMKVGVTTPIDAARKGYTTWTGDVYAESIHPDDYVMDMFARTEEDCGFKGHRYRADVEIANRQFKLRGENRLEQDGNRSIDLDGDERVSMISRGYSIGDDNTFRQQCDVWELWVTHPEPMVLTFRSQSNGAPAGANDLLKAYEYVGPYCGQYTTYGLIPVSGQLPPKGPIVDQIGMDVAMNAVLRKIIRQVDRFKQLDLYTGQASDDARRINLANDGDMVQVNNINGFRPWASTPPNAQIFGLMMQFKQLHSQICGNLDAIAGLSRQAGTARQDSQILQQSTAGVSLYRDIVTKCTSKVMEDMLWYYWHDLTGVMDDTYRLEADKNYEMRREVGPEARRDLTWEDLECSVDPYSFVGSTPAERRAHMRELVQTAIPLTPYLQQQGITLDARFWFKKEGEYTDNPDVEELFNLTEPLTVEAEEDKPGKPASDKTYTHRSESEATEDGQAQEMIQDMMGAGAVGAGEFGEQGGMKI
jgi:hypothetical protein